ncbi:MAG: pilus assembly protein [Proteobacteria bacterium]|nr:pilus assembly protein [Pseudomonadota bacterium]
MDFFKKFAKEERGAAAVEFTLVFPAYLLIVVGIIELGYLLWGYSALEYGASYGARYAFVHPTSSATTIQNAAMGKIGATGSPFSYTATISSTSVDLDGTFSYTFFFIPLSPITISTHVHQVLPPPPS